MVEKAAADAGVDQRLIELVKIRASMLNGCAFYLDMHSRDARKLGESERRIALVSAWRETDLYSEQERAALALTDAMTRLSETQDVSARCTRTPPASSLRSSTWSWPGRSR